MSNKEVSEKMNKKIKIDTNKEEMEYKYTLIVSQYYHSFHFFVVKCPNKKELIRKFREFASELDAYKGGGKRNKLLKTSDVFYYEENEEIRYRYNVNANGDIYFLNFCYLNRIQIELRKYYDDQRRMSQGYKKKAILEAIEENHDYYKVAEIVEKYFEIA